MLRERSGDYLQRLRGFYFVASTGSVHKAAAHMCRNASTISYQIRCLEEELGIELFDRTTKKMVLNEAGKKLLNWTTEVFLLFEKMNFDVSSYKNIDQIKIRIACTTSFAHLVAGAISNFHENNFSVSIYQCGCIQALSALHDNKVDIVTGGGLELPVEENMDVLFQARQLLVLSTDSPWAVSIQPSLEELRRLPLIGFNVEDFTVSSVASQERLNLKKLYEYNSNISTNSYYMMLDFVRKKIGAAIFDELCFRDIRTNMSIDGLAVYSLDHVLPRNDYGILVSKHKRNDTQINKLIKNIKQHVAEQIFETPFVDLPVL